MENLWISTSTNTSCGASHWQNSQRLDAACRANVSWDQIHFKLGSPLTAPDEGAGFKLPLERIRVTSVDNFWSSVDATLAMGRPLTAQAGHLTCMGARNCTDADVALQHLATDLRGTVVILPRAVPKVVWFVRLPRVFNLGLQTVNQGHVLLSEELQRDS